MDKTIKTAAQSTQNKKVITIALVIFGLIALCCICSILTSAFGGTDKLKDVNDKLEEKQEELEDKTQNNKVTDLGVSYENAVLVLDKYYTLERSTKTDGTPRYYGSNEGKYSHLEVLGEEKAKSLTLWFNISKDMDRDVIEERTDMLSEVIAFILMNLFPEKDRVSVKDFIFDTLFTDQELSKDFTNIEVTVSSSASSMNHTIYFKPNTY